MIILNTNFNTNIKWSLESALKVLKKANPKTEEKELISLIKKSKLIKEDVRQSTNKGKKGAGNTKPNGRKSDNI